MGDILFTSNVENPVTSYLGTTWELLPVDKFIKTGNSPLQQAGNNSITIQKTNLPNVKLKADSFSVSYGNSYLSKLIHSGSWGSEPITNTENGISPKAKYTGGDSGVGYAIKWENTLNNKASSTLTPYTEALGSGTPITINPTHITLIAWKRLS